MNPNSFVSLRNLIIFYIHDKFIWGITGKSYRQSTRLLNKIREDLNKDQKSLVSIIEFCQYTGLEYEPIISNIVG